jgi:hypothetical protein
LVAADIGITPVVGDECAGFTSFGPHLASRKCPPEFQDRFETLCLVRTSFFERQSVDTNVIAIEEYVTK